MKKKLIIAAAVLLVLVPTLAGQKQTNKPGHDSMQLLMESLDQVIKLASSDSSIRRETKMEMQSLKANAQDAEIAAKEEKLSGQYQRILEDVCVQCGIIKRNLPAATQQKAAPAIQTVREFWRSHPWEPDVVGFTGSEVQRIFGSRPKNVEDVLVCYVFCVALNCLEKTLEEAWLTEFENFDQKINQLFDLISVVLKNEKEMQVSIMRNLK